MIEQSECQATQFGPTSISEEDAEAGLIQEQIDSLGPLTFGFDYRHRVGRLGGTVRRRGSLIWACGALMQLRIQRLENRWESDGEPRRLCAADCTAA